MGEHRIVKITKLSLRYLRRYISNENIRNNLLLVVSFLDLREVVTTDQESASDRTPHKISANVLRTLRNKDPHPVVTPMKPIVNSHMLKELQE